jgi:predicted ABC-type ATPase
VDVRRRYDRSIENLRMAARLADHVLLFDNSTEQGYQIVAILTQTLEQWFEPSPLWATSFRSTVPRK